MGINNWTESEIKILIDNYGNISTRKLAKKYNMHQTTIADVVSYRKWKHLK